MSKSKKKSQSQQRRYAKGEIMDKNITKITNK